MQEDVRTTVASWSEYKAFADARDELANAPWERARGELHTVEDFVATWARSGEAMGASAMKLTLLRDVDAFRRWESFSPTCHAVSTGPFLYHSLHLDRPGVSGVQSTCLICA